MPVIVREFRQSDIEAIDRIYNKQPTIDVPSLKDIIINATIEKTETKEILGYGAVKLFAESILILDKQASKKDKAKAVTESMLTAILACKEAGLEHLFAVANDLAFARVLENRYKFTKIPGVLLRLEL